jgi:DUF4097 and DUF4098 domain-containing protein YvlB
MNTRQILLAFYVPAVALATVGSCVGTGVAVGPRATGSFERTLEAAGPVGVEVETDSGAIAVRSDDTDEVRIKAAVTVSGALLDKRPSEELLRDLSQNPPVERVGDVIRIGRIADRQTRERVRIAYELVLPRRARLQATSGSGQLHVEGVAGPLALLTGSGVIDVTGARADVHAETGSGAIRLADAQGGRFDLATGSGGIEARDVKGAMRAHAGSGGISVAGDPVERWELKTGSGEVHTHLLADAGFDLSAHTGSGGIQVAQVLTGSERSEGSLRGRAGAGGPQLDLTTGSGGIRVE